LIHRACHAQSLRFPPSGDANSGVTDPMSWTLEMLEQRVFAILRDDLLAVGDDFNVDSDLVAAGLDSMAVTQLMLAIEESTGVWVDESLLTPENLASARTLAACVHTLLR
jgi:acyl carrier protein